MPTASPTSTARSPTAGATSSRSRTPGCRRTRWDTGDPPLPRRRARRDPGHRQRRGTGLPRRHPARPLARALHVGRRARGGDRGRRRVLGLRGRGSARGGHGDPARPRRRADPPRVRRARAPAPGRGRRPARAPLEPGRAPHARRHVGVGRVGRPLLSPPRVRARPGAARRRAARDVLDDPRAPDRARRSSWPGRRYRPRECASRPGTSTRSSSGCRGCCPGWTSAGRTWSACRRRSSPTTPSPSCSAPSSATAATRSRAHGEADLERRRDPLARRARRRRRGARRRARLPASRGPRGVGDLRRHPGRLASTSRTGAMPGLRALRTTSSPGWPRCARRSRPGPEATIVCGDMNIAPDRRRRVRPRRLRRPDPRHRARARGAGGAAGARPARRRARPLAGRARLHLLGLPRRHVPPGPGDADRPRPGQRAGRRPRRAPPGSTATRARAPGRATTRR